MAFNMDAPKSGFQIENQKKNEVKTGKKIKKSI